MLCGVIGGHKHLLSCCCSILRVLLLSVWSQDCLQLGKLPCFLFFSLGAKHQNCTQYLSLISYWLKLSHMAMLAAREDGKYSPFFQAFMCLDKILLLEKKRIEDMRGQPSSLFQACGLDYFRSSCFGLVS